MKIMHTMASQEIAAMPKRRFYEPQLKRQIVAESHAPGASVAGVALAHGVMVKHFTMTTFSICHATPSTIDNE
jgi:hypothetical protein